MAAGGEGSAFSGGSVRKGRISIPRRLRAALILIPLCAGAILALTIGVPRPWHPALATTAPPHPKAAIDTTLARDDEGCAGVRGTVWHPLSGVEYTGRLRVHLPAQVGGALVLFIGDRIPLDIDADPVDGRPIMLHQERLPPGPGVHVPPDFWLDDSTPWSAPPEIVRVSVDALPLRDLDFILLLGRRAPRVLARLTGYPDDVRVPVCAERVKDGERYFATGWYGEESGDFGRVRWMRDSGAVLLPSADGRAVHLRLRAAPAAEPAGGDETLLRVRVNDFVDLPPVPMRSGFADYEWDVPDAAWVAGTNELLLTVSRTVSRGTRTLGLAMSSLTAR